MKISKKVFSFILLAVLFISTNTHAIAFENKTQENPTQILSYDYPITPGTDEWKKLTTHKQMLEAVQVPEDILENMDTQELIITVLENPMILDMYAYYTPEEGFDKGYDILCQKLNCVRELDTRSDSIAYLSNTLNNISMLSVLTGDNYTSEQLESINLAGKRILECIMQKSISNYRNNETVRYAIKTVYTPKGSSVSVLSGLTWADHDMKSTEAKIQSDAIMQIYPNAVKIAAEAPNYNCHNFAWNKTSPNSYWMDNPSKYMNDGSYVKSLSASSGYNVYYPNGNHSAIIKSNYDDNIYVKSKWGALPAFEHNVRYSPYDDTGITFWKKS